MDTSLVDTAFGPARAKMIGSKQKGPAEQVAPSEFLSAYYLWDSEFLSHGVFFEELSEFDAELNEAQWVLVFQTVLSKQYSRNSTPPIS